MTRLTSEEDFFFGVKVTTELLSIILWVSAGDTAAGNHSLTQSASPRQSCSSLLLLKYPSTSSESLSRWKVNIWKTEAGFTVYFPVFKYLTADVYSRNMNSNNKWCQTKNVMYKKKRKFFVCSRIVFKAVWLSWNFFSQCAHHHWLMGLKSTTSLQWMTHCWLKVHELTNNKLHLGK